MIKNVGALFILVTLTGCDVFGGQAHNACNEPRTVITNSGKDTTLVRGKWTWAYTVVNDVCSAPGGETPSRMREYTEDLSIIITGGVVTRSSPYYFDNAIEYGGALSIYDGLLGPKNFFVSEDSLILVSIANDGGFEILVRE